VKRLAAILGSGLAIAALAVTATLYTAPKATSSDHQDSPLTVSRPGADITDVFLFPAADPNKVVLAMDIHPLIPRGMSGGVAFDPGVMYQLKIATDGGFKESKVIQMRAVGTGTNQRLEFYGPVAPAMAGTTSRWVGSPQGFSFNKVTKLRNGVQVFAGPRQDPFYFDLAQFFKIVPDRNYKNHPNVPPPTAKCFRKPGVDFLRNYNVLSFVVELPRTMLAGRGNHLGVIRMYATTSLPSGQGNYTQVERLARPAVKEAFESFANHDRTNRSSPWNDALLGQSITSFMTAAPPNGAGRSMQLAKAVKGVLIPDELAADLSQKGPARYLAVETNGKSGLPTGVVRAVPEAALGGIKKAIGDPYRHFGGRDPSSPVIDLSLGVIFGTLGQKVGLAPDDHKDTACLTSDNVTAGDRGTTPTFPYFGRPI
jgi:hypothetical protein